MSTAAPRRHWKRWVLLVLAAVFTAVVTRAYLKLKAVPAYWEQNQSFLQQTQPEELQKLASSFELRAPREWTRPVGGGSGDRTLAFGFDEVNAWLALRLESLLKNQGISASGIGGAMLTERDGRLVLAVNRDDGKLAQVISLFVAVEEALAEDGGGTPEPTFRVAAIRGGDFNLPLSVITKAVDPAKIRDPQRRELVTQLAAGEAVGPLILPVDAHRKARVRGFRVTTTGVEVDVTVSYNEDPAP